MREQTVLDEVNQVNIAFLSLLRDMAQKSETQALEEMGLNAEMCSRFAALSDVQMQRLGATGQLLCRFQMQADDLLFSLGNPVQNRLEQRVAAESPAMAVA